MRRKAFTLVEVLVVITVLPIVAIAFSGLFATFTRDVPRLTRMVQENTSVLDLARHIHDDVDAAVALPDAAHEWTSDDRTLLIGLPERVICYRIDEDGVTRTVLAGGQGEPQTEGIWRFRDAVIAWRLQRRADRAHALEVQTSLKERLSGKIRQRFANSHLCFLGGLAQEQTP